MVPMHASTRRQAFITQEPWMLFLAGVFSLVHLGLRPLHMIPEASYDPTGRVTETNNTRTGGISGGIVVAIGIFAWNEERAIAAALNSLFQQTLFAGLSRRNTRCQLICVTNGCTDQTPVIADQIFSYQESHHPYASAFTCQIARIEQRGKLNAWNRFVHCLSAKEAHCLFMMDADILLHRSDTLWNMFIALEKHPESTVAVDRPRKDILFKTHKSIRDWFSIGASRMTGAADSQLCAQLYCIRTDTARKIYLPKDLSACEDGFLKALVCTDNLTHELCPERIHLTEHAEHTFE